MNSDLTRPFHPDPAQVRYRCTCGVESVVARDEGGACGHCHRTISPKTLQHELALTMTINTLNGDFTTSLEAQEAASVSPDTLIGTTLGHFEIVAPLGAGGMGQVYQALDKSLQRYVAVKVLHSGIGSTANLSSSDSEIDNLLQEAVTQARVTHPNIVTIYYVGKQDGNPFLAMELINGTPLNQLLSESKLSFTEIGPIAIQIVEALKFSYELDIIHGDIKPSNVLLQPNGNIKLSDFGMARRASDESSRRVGGTPNYIAPELLTGSTPSVHSDMYALGVTLYELTFGKLPISLSGSKISEWIATHRQSKIEFPTPWPDHLPEGWRAILLKLMAPDPKRRYSNYSELLEDLNTVQPGSKVLARRVPRLIAAAIDYAVVLLLMVPIQALVGAEMLSNFLGDHQFVRFLLQASDLLPIVGYTITIAIWRQSIGRALMHVRAVNQYGLTPTRRVMAMRSVMRMCLIWLVCLAIFFSRTNSEFLEWTSLTISAVFLLYWLADVGLMMFHEYARSIHDLVFGTRVVLDTD